MPEPDERPRLRGVERLLGGGRMQGARAGGKPEPDTMTPSWSLQRRLQRQLLALLFSLWLAGSVAALFGLGNEITEVLDSALAETAQSLLVLPDHALGDEHGLALAAGIGEHEEHVIYQLFDQHGHLRLRSHAAPQQPISSSTVDGIRDVGDWHVLTLSRADGTRRAFVAETVAHRREVLWAGMGWLLGMLGAVLPLAAVGLRLLLRRAFATLEPARRELAQRDAHDLRPLAASQTPIELRPWLDAVDALMTRVRSLVEAERAFAAHMAHELRTPLAAARAQAQRLLSATGGGPQRAPALALVRQLDRLTALATRLLQLARIDSGVALQREPVDLVRLATLVADEFGDARRSGQLRLQVQGKPAAVAGDWDALGIALRNLIDNALKHGASPAGVTLQVSPGRLAVIDDGPGVAAEMLPRLARPFERAQAVAEGSGLGLAMVATVARQSSARLTLQSPVADRRGFSATLCFLDTPDVAASGQPAEPNRR